MDTKSRSSFVWGIVVLVVAALTAVVVTFVFASAEAGSIVALCTTVILPVVVGLLNLLQGNANHQQTTNAIENVHESLANRIRNP